MILAATNLVWVPVTVKNHHCVSSLQVQPQSSCPCTQQENEVRWVLGIKQGQQLTSVLTFSCTVQAEVRESLTSYENLEKNDEHNIQGQSLQGLPYITQKFNSKSCNKSNYSCTAVSPTSIFFFLLVAFLLSNVSTFRGNWWRRNLVGLFN